MEDVLRPLDKDLPKSIGSGREAIDYANQIISARYDDILQKMNVTQDDIFSNEIATLHRSAATLPKRELRKFDQILDEKLRKVFNDKNGSLLGQEFKKIDAGLRFEYKRMLKSADPYQQDLGTAIKTAHTSLLNLGKRENPELGRALDSTDIAFAKMRVVDDAAAMLGATEGQFTPNQMLNAIKKNTNKKDFAAGHGFDQAETEAAKAIIANTVPNSGTTDRALIAALSTGALPFNTTAAALGGLGLLAYTKTGQRILNKALFDRPQTFHLVGDILEKSAKNVSMAGASTAINLRN